MYVSKYIKWITIQNGEDNILVNQVKVLNNTGNALQCIKK